MSKCNNTKLMQIYLDGWMGESEIKKFEDHLKDCPECQMELVDLEEVTRATLEIVDQAPEREYWDNFVNRVNNRIAARDVSMEISSSRKSKSFSVKYSLYSVAVMAFAASLLIIFDIGINKKPNPNQAADSNLYAPISGNLPLIFSGAEQALPSSNSNISQTQEASMYRQLKIPVRLCQRPRNRRIHQTRQALRELIPR